MTTSRLVLQHVTQELSPYPGRLAGSLRDTLAVCLALLLALTLRVPNIALSLALLFLMQREHPALTLRVALQLVAGVAVSAAVSLLYVQWTDGTEWARFFGITLIIFCGAFCIAATTLPLFWTMFAFYGFLDMAGWDAHRGADAIVRSTLYNLASVALVVACGLAVEYAFSTRQPQEDLETEMTRRLVTLGRYYRAMERAAGKGDDTGLYLLRATLLQFASDGGQRLLMLYDMWRDRLGAQGQVPPGVHYRIGLLVRAVDHTIEWSTQRSESSEQVPASVYGEIALQCEALAAGHVPPPIGAEQVAALPVPLRAVTEGLQHYSAIPAPGSPLEQSFTLLHRQREPMFLPDAFSSADAVFYALKLTLAAVGCYILYNAIAWPEIATCVVTVLFTGLSSTGAMKQKQLYRLAGAIVGGAMGIAAVSLLLPNMDSITSLLCLVAPVTLLSAWTMRSPRMGYVGVQIAFGFFLTALPGFSASMRINPARDRVIGIAVGVVVMWFVFDQLWPSRTSDVLAQALRRIRGATETLNAFDIISRRRRAQLRFAVARELAAIQQMNFAVQFEWGRHRKREIARTKRLMREIESSAATFYERLQHTTTSGDDAR